MKKIKQSPKLPAEARREQLLDSARSLFVKKGYRMTTTEEIAGNAGLTKGALYYHFSSKEDILFALIKSMFSHMESTVKERLGESITPTELLSIMLQAHAEEKSVEYWDTVDIMVQALRIPRVKRYVKTQTKQAAEDFSGRLDPKLWGAKKQRMEVALMIFALCDGLSVMMMFDPDRVNIRNQLKLFDRMMQGISRGTTKDNG
jgi:TetR/AcrR family acrAB operon transcriptional repressor